MTSTPLMSFIILSYNYRDYVSETLRSVLAQTVQDFEVVVVDDCSTDNSVEVIASFADPRIRLLRSEKNSGGAGAYNRAVSAAQGEFLVNLDADDSHDPMKCEKQLGAFRNDPGLDIVGTHVRAIDKDGLLHPEAAQFEVFFNHALDLNLVSSWALQNPLCRSSTMMRRASHLRVGLNDLNMNFTGDFELWTRALREGCRFAVIPEKLCNYRWHGGNITHRAPQSQFLELAYICARNLMPVIEHKALYPVMARVLSTLAEHEQFAKLSPRARYRLIAGLLARPPATDFAGYRDAILSPTSDSERETLGRRALALIQFGPGQIANLANEVDTKRLTAAIDHYRRSSDDYQRSSEQYRRSSEEWEARYARSLSGRLAQIGAQILAKIRRR